MRCTIRSAGAVGVTLGAFGLSLLSGCTGLPSLDEPVLAPQSGAWVDARANEFTASAQAGTVVDIFENGDLLVAWDSRRQQGGQYGVYARVLNGRIPASRHGVRMAASGRKRALLLRLHIQNHREARSAFCSSSVNATLLRR